MYCAGPPPPPLVAMLISIFSSPEQIVKNPIEPPEIDTQELEAVLVNASMHSENSEEPFQMEINGIIYEVHIDEAARVEINRREAEEQAEQAEKEWWESRQDWTDRSPFEPTYHPEITFDPNIYDTNQWRPQ